MHAINSSSMKYLVPGLPSKKVLCLSLLVLLYIEELLLAVVSTYDLAGVYQNLCN